MPVGGSIFHYWSVAVVTKLLTLVWLMALTGAACSSATDSGVATGTDSNESDPVEVLAFADTVSRSAADTSARFEGHYRLVEAGVADAADTDPARDADNGADTDSVEPVDALVLNGSFDRSAGTLEATIEMGPTVVASIVGRERPAARF